MTGESLHNKNNLNKAKYLLFAGKIKIIIRAEGSDDPDKQGYCSIKVNGVDRSSRVRGHNVVILDDSGNFVTSKSFDTGDASRDEGSAMASFLDCLPNERIVLIATQDTKGRDVIQPLYL